MQQKGIKITDLEYLNAQKLPNSGAGKEIMLIIKDSRAYQIDTNTFYNTFTGVKDSKNLGSKLNIFNNYDTSNSTLYFNTLTATGALSAGLRGNVVEIILRNDIITNSYVKDGAITPTKQSGTLTSSVTLTAFTQSIAANTFSYINGLCATITPPTVNSKIMLGGYVSVGAADAGMNLYRVVNNIRTNVFPLSVAPTTSLSKITMFDVGQGVANNAITVPISFLDAPNTISPVTYVFGISAVTGVCYINRPVTAPGTAAISYSTSHLYAVALP